MKRALTTGMTIFALILSGCGGGAGGGASGGGATPEACFEAMKSAATKGDWATMASQATPESHDVMIGGLAMMVQFAGAFGGGEQMKPVTEVLTKHGVKMDLKVDPAAGKPEEAFKQMTAGVKNKPACIGEVLAAMEKAGDAKTADEAKAMATAKLADVKVTGDTATAKLTTTKGGMEKTEEVKFKKINGKWFADLASSMGGPGM